MLMQMNQVSKRFTLHQRDGVELPVLNRVDLNIEKGECVVLDGPSGMGKSTLLKLIYANYRASSGTITINKSNGQSIELTKATPRELLEIRRETIGYVSQFLRVIPRVSALEIVVDPLIEDVLTSQQNSQEMMNAAITKAKNLLTRLSIPERLWHLPPATFSGGEQQRINIARNLIKHRELLLLDEPTASLDVENSQTVIALIKEAIERGSAVVGIFHDKQVAEAVATRRIDMAQYQYRSAA
jgi:alpha-D-ribose 1-methylphosphonate 5-triphosphate synthase subunit PhnL